MRRETLVLSIKPEFVRRILDGSKRVELRRVAPRAHDGQPVLIYCSSPVKAFVAQAVVERIETGSRSATWTLVRDVAGVSRAEYRTYFKGAERAVGIWLSNVSPLPDAISLPMIRKRWPWFTAPQSYAFVQASFLGQSGESLSLSPRHPR